MTVIENINIAYVSQDLSLLSSADADGTILDDEYNYVYLEGMEFVVTHFDDNFQSTL